MKRLWALLRPHLRRIDALFGQASPLVAARAASALFTLAVPLLLARLFARDEFGHYKQFFLILLTVLLIGQLGLTQSLYYFLPRGEARRGAFVTQALAGLAVVGLVVGLIVVSLRSFGAYRYPLAICCAGALASAPLEAALTAEGRIGAAACAYLAFELLRASALIVGTRLGGLMGCLWGAAAVMILRAVLVHLLHAVRLLPRGRPSRAMLRTQLGYALPFAASTLVYVAQGQLTQYVVSLRFDAATFALFSVAAFHLQSIDMIYTPVTEVLIVRIGRAWAAKDQSAALEAWHDSIGRLAALFFPMSCLFWSVGHALVPALFTAKYAASVPLFFILTGQIAVAILPVDAALRATAQMRFLLHMNLWRLALTLTLLLVGMRLGGLGGLALAWVLAELGGRLLMVARSRQCFKATWKAFLPWRALGRHAAWAVAPAVPAFVLVRLLDASPKAAVAAGIAAYGMGWGALWWLRQLEPRPEPEPTAG